jgi:acyl-CoA hydrolase
MEIGVHVAAENSHNGDSRHVVSAYLTFVALDDKGRPVTVPTVVPETEDQKRRFEGAGLRREIRLRHRQQVA